MDNEKSTLAPEWQTWAVAVVGAFVLSIVVKLTTRPTPAEFSQAASQTTAPCYYFCGPWYTWFWTWVAFSIIGAILFGAVWARIQRRDEDG